MQDELSFFCDCFYILVTHIILMLRTKGVDNILNKEQKGRLVDAGKWLMQLSTSPDDTSGASEFALVTMKPTIWKRIVGLLKVRTAP